MARGTHLQMGAAQATGTDDTTEDEVATLPSAGAVMGGSEMTVTITALFYRYCSLR